jgi:Tfp pilus assembly protein FimT
MTALTIPALNAFKNSSDVTTAAYDISGMLQLARTYAMTNNTYVYVGFEEVNAGVSSNAATQTPGVGRLAVVAAASRDGTPGYGSGMTGWLSTGAGLVQVSRLLRVDNVHVPFSLGSFPTSGNMSATAGRRDITLRNPSYEILSSEAISATPFNYPLGATSPQYIFQNVIQFDPQGSARILTYNGQTVDTSSMPWCIEVFLQQTHGAMVPATPTLAGNGAMAGNNVSIQVDGMTGGVRIFRP